MNADTGIISLITNYIYVVKKSAQVCWGLCKLLKAKSHLLPIHQSKAPVSHLSESTVSTARSTTPWSRGWRHLISSHLELSCWPAGGTSVIVAFPGAHRASRQGEAMASPVGFQTVLSSLASFWGASSFLLAGLQLDQQVSCQGWFQLQGDGNGREAAGEKNLLPSASHSSLLVVVSRTYLCCSDVARKC